MSSSNCLSLYLLPISFRLVDLSSAFNAEHFKAFISHDVRQKGVAVRNCVVCKTNCHFVLQLILRISPLLSLVYLKPCGAFHIKIRVKCYVVMHYEYFVLTPCYFGEHACCSCLQGFADIIC